jgi:predicted nucleotidyltransferase
VIRIAEQVGAAAAADEVLLFGSYAKGRQDVHSDVDLVVVLSRPPSPALRMAAEDAGRGHPLKVDVLVHERSTLLTTAAAQPLSLLDSALRHAVTVFRRPDVVSILDERELAREFQGTTAADPV